MTGNWRIALAFFAIYVVWGSTYLAIRYAVESIPPLTTAGVRHLVAGLVLYALARWHGQRPRPGEWRASLFLGALFFLLGHGSLHWAERVVPSGLAALLVATEPVWIATLLALAPGGPRLTTQTVAGLGVGLAGVAVLMQSDVLRVTERHLAGALAIVGGAVAWSVGVVYSRSARLPADALLRTATTLLCGAVLLLATAVAVGEPAQLSAASVSIRSILSLAYLIVFGSLIAYTAYVWLLERCSPTLVATHTYVNPVVAVVLGWSVGDGPFASSVVVSGVLIVLAIALVGRRGA